MNRDSHEFQDGSSGRNTGKSLLRERIGKWVESVFRSSADEGRIFKLRRPFELETGEACHFIIVVSCGASDEEGVSRGSIFSFSNGMAREDLCSIDYSLSFDSAGELNRITKDTRSGRGEDLRVRCEDFFSDEAVTDKEQFESASAEIERIRVAIHGLPGQRLPNSHPLLNPYFIKGIELGGMDGDGYNR
jgi:hypothetical protein